MATLTSATTMTLMKSMIPQEGWFVDEQHDTGISFLRRDSSRVKFRCEVEVLEFVRSPEEMRFMTTKEYIENASHPLVVIATCVFAIAVTVVIPWVFMSTGIQ